MPKDLPRTLTSCGTAFHAAGEGEAIMLIHGVGLRAECWAYQLDALATSNRVIAVDLPGHGGSRGVEACDPSLKDYTDRIRMCIDELVGEPVILAGHSMGAMIALDLASRYPESVLGVAALNAVYDRSREACKAVHNRAIMLAEGGASDISAAPVLRWFGDSPQGTDLRAAELCKAWLNNANRQAYVAAYAVFANGNGPTRQQLTGLDMPALFLTGECDQNSTPAMSYTMADLAPRAETSVIAQAGHMAQLTHAAEVNAALSAFASRVHNEKHLVDTEMPR